MIILPVLDLLNGEVVRGVAGRRNEYRPVESALADDARPLSVAHSFRERLGLGEFYVADLDAILHDRPSIAIVRELVESGFRLHVDAGPRDADRARELLAIGARSVVAGLETLPGPRALREIVRACGAERVIFSLDLHAGKPLTARAGAATTTDPTTTDPDPFAAEDPADWGAGDPLEIAALAAEAGITRLIVLDLAGVGVNGGVSTLPLCRELRRRFPRWEILTGGGVRHSADLRAVRDAGLEGALVASALHDGRIAREDVLAALAPATEAGRFVHPHFRSEE
ncbi:MAG: HisA/HisF-related TIM barrel protein [Planctomycetaceae bacterium]